MIVYENDEYAVCQEVDYDDYNFCPECGQALDLSDENDL